MWKITVPIAVLSKNDIAIYEFPHQLLLICLTDLLNGFFVFSNVFFPMCLETTVTEAMVFLMQLFDGRIDYSNATLLGLLTYMFGALLGVYGATVPVSFQNSENANADI